MKTVLYVLVVVVLCGLLSSSAQAQSPIGPPVATLDQGQFAAGFSYSHLRSDLEATVLGLSFTAEDSEIDTYMANLLYGLDESIELQLDLGASYNDSDEYTGSTDFAFGFGLKTTVAEQDKVKWGAAFLMHWYEASGSGTTLGIDWTEEDSWSEIKLAVGPSYEAHRFCLYGGPFLHWIDGDIEGTIAGVPVSGSFEEDSMFGGFVGAQIEVAPNTYLGIEYQNTGSASAICANVLFRF